MVKHSNDKFAAMNAGIFIGIDQYFDYLEQLFYYSCRNAKLKKLILKGIGFDEKNSCPIGYR